MDNLIFSVNGIMPLFLVIALGYLLKKCGFASKKFIDDGNKLAANILIPSLLFYNVYSADFSKTFNASLLAFCLGGLVLTFSIAFFVARIISDKDSMRGAASQGMARSNSVIFSLELMNNLYGAAGERAYSVIAAFFVPMANFLNVLILCIYDPTRKSADLKKTIIKIVFNPFIVAGLSAVALNLSGLVLPSSVISTLNNLGAIGSSFTLILVGMDFEFGSVGKNLKKILSVSCVKLIIFPIIMLTAAYFAGFRGTDFAIVLTGFCPPTAVASYAMAKLMHADSEFAGQIVIFTTLFSILTTFIYIFVSRSLNII